jgi:hypothetical protein
MGLLLLLLLWGCKLQDGCGRDCCVLDGRGHRESFEICRTKVNGHNNNSSSIDGIKREQQQMSSGAREYSAWRKHKLHSECSLEHALLR